MSSIPQISESAIRRWTDAAYFQRGKDYFERGAIYDKRCQGMKISSKCAGTQAPFYRQEVLFNRKGIESAECSCPVGAGGRCKHVVALLLTWVYDPDSFQETHSIDKLLEKRSKPELILLIKEMLEQEPELDYLLELPLSVDEKVPLNIETIRRQAERAFVGSDVFYNEWIPTREIAQNLDALLKLAEGYLARKDPANAALIYQIVIETIIDHRAEALGDENGTLLGVIYRCCEALGDCLDALSERVKRREVLQALFNAHRWNTIEAGYGATDCVPEIFLSRTTPEERKEIAAWTRKILPRGNDWLGGYSRQVLGGLILDLEADTLDDEAYLEICRETGRLHDLMERLLQLKRIHEAEAAAAAARDSDLLNVLDIFIRHKQINLAEKLVTERLDAVGWENVDNRLIEWLSNRFKKRSDLARSLELEERLFWKHPDIEQYKELRRLARKMNRWEDLRARITTELKKRKNTHLLIETYLVEKEAGKALTVLKEQPVEWGGQQLRLQVAQAAKKQYPREALRIFWEEAQRLIDGRNRDSYSQAALCLREIRDIYWQLNEKHAWQELIADVRAKYKILRALQDELNKCQL